MIDASRRWNFKLRLANYHRDNGMKIALPMPERQSDLCNLNSAAPKLIELRLATFREYRRSPDAAICYFALYHCPAMPFTSDGLIYSRIYAERIVASIIYYF